MQQLGMKPDTWTRKPPPQMAGKEESEVMSDGIIHIGAREYSIQCGFCWNEEVTHRHTLAQAKTDFKKWGFILRGKKWFCSTKCHGRHKNNARDN